MQVPDTAPDVPHIGLETLQSCTGGVNVGQPIKSSVPLEESFGGVVDLDGMWDDLEYDGEAKLEFQFNVGGDNNDGEEEIRWKARLLPEGRLLVEIPNSCLPKGSKESFVSLMEFAEEVLECDQILIKFSKDRQDRASLIRTFLYFGFQLVSPNDPMVELLAGSPHKNFLMVCNMD